ncbi:hypothetical protein [Microbacterium sp. 22242]|uniref:hypothetical protein n=1 Tax=Microbacterium sp. 22242 TaxID=3453896 RepID=UPI003F849454
MRHEPWPVVVEIIEDVGGVPVLVGAEVQLRCSCRDDLLLDYGHEAAAGDGPAEGGPAADKE